MIGYLDKVIRPLVLILLKMNGYVNKFTLRESVQIQRFFWSVFSPKTGKYRPEKTLYLDIFHAVLKMEYKWWETIRKI